MQTCLQKVTLIVLIDSFVYFHSSFFTFWRMSIMNSEGFEVVSSLSKDYKTYWVIHRTKRKPKIDRN